MLILLLALLESSVEANIPQEYRELLLNWNGNDAIDGAIRNGNYLGENGEEIQPPSKAGDASSSSTPIALICEKYQEAFAEFCKSSDPRAIKVLNGEFNTALKAQWRTSPDTEQLEPPNWSDASQRLEIAKAVRQKRDVTAQFLGALTEGRQRQGNPEYNKLHSAKEVEKARFRHGAKKCGFPEVYCKTYDDAIDLCESINPALAESIDKITAQVDPTSAAADVEMKDAEDAGTLGNLPQPIRVYDSERDTWDEIIAYRKYRGGHQILVQKTPDGAKIAVCHILPAKPHRDKFDDFKDFGGMNVRENQGSSQDLKGTKLKDFEIQRVAYIPRKTDEPSIGRAKWADMMIYGKLDGASQCRFWNRSEVPSSWGTESLLGKILESIKDAGLEPPTPPTRNRLAYVGRLTIQNQPHTTGPLGNENRQDQLLLHEKMHRGNNSQPQLGVASGNGTQFPMKNNGSEAVTQPQIGEAKPILQMSIEDMMKELQVHRGMAATPTAGMVSDIQGQPA